MAYVPQAISNGWLENRSYQFTSTDARYLFILQAQQKEISQGGGYNSTVNFNGDIGQFGDQYNADHQIFNNSTSIGNLSSVDVSGDNNSVNGNQDNNQGSNTSIGQTLDPFVGKIGDSISFGNGG